MNKQLILTAIIAILLSTVLSGCIDDEKIPNNALNDVEIIYSPSFVINNSANLINKTISVKGTVEMGVPACTKMMCPPDDPCCNTCTDAELYLCDNNSKIQTSGSCSECCNCGGWSCNPLDLGEEYVVVGIWTGDYLEIISYELIETDLSLSISVNESYVVGEKILVEVTLKNSGIGSFNLSALSLAGGSLDFTINTPDGKVLRYIGPEIDCRPPMVVLLPGEQISIVVDISDDVYTFGEVFYEPYAFTKTGSYTIKADYYSSGSFYNCEEKGWVGSISSEECNFAIKI